VNESIQSSFPEDNSVRTGDSDHLKWGDLIARRRLHWVAEKFEGRIQEYVDDPGVDSTSGELYI